jgi:predicted ABC-type transport system involved in lysophospholipase L1 biosynthesis ATPase subunit
MNTACPLRGLWAMAALPSALFTEEPANQVIFNRWLNITALLWEKKATAPPALLLIIHDITER